MGGKPFLPDSMQTLFKTRLNRTACGAAGILLTIAEKYPTCQHDRHTLQARYTLPSRIVFQKYNKDRELSYCLAGTRRRGRCVGQRLVAPHRLQAFSMATSRNSPRQEHGAWQMAVTLKPQGREVDGNPDPRPPSHAFRKVARRWRSKLLPVAQTRQKRRHLNRSSVPGRKRKASEDTRQLRENGR